MLSASQIKFIRSLSQQKFRNMYRQFVIEGDKMVKELFASDFLVEAIYATGDWFKKAGHLPGMQGSKTTVVSPAELKRISNLKTANKVLAVVRIPEVAAGKEIFDDLVLALDRIADPGNLGTIIRIADWFGIEHIICSHDTVELYNPKVVRATMGSLFRVKVHYVDLAGTLSKLACDVPKYAATLDGENIYKKVLPQSAVIIIGSESHGISDPVSRLIDQKVMIPAADSSAESLNASVAAAIICSEFRRKILQKVQ
jgi:RNA methyltransferase, TrmH family